MRFHTILSVALLLVAAVAGTNAEQERQHRAKRVRLLSEAAQNAYVPAAGALYSAPAPAAGQLYAGAPAAGALYTGAKPAADALYAGSATSAPAPAAGALYTGAKPAAGALYAGAAPSAGQLYAGATPAAGQLYAAPAPASGASVSSSCFYTGPAGSYCTQSPEPHYYCGPAVFTGSNYNCIAESSTVFGCTPSGQLCQLQKNSKEAPCLAKSNFC